MNKIASDRILAYRRHLYSHISLLLDVYGSGATVEDAAKLIFEYGEASHPSECLADLLMMFNPCEEDYLSFMPVIQDAWNYFPHRSLGGKCPAEIISTIVRPIKARQGEAIDW